MATVLDASIESFRYPRSSESVLKPIRLKVEEGEFVVITGPAGSGKTTLCHCLTGVIPKFIAGEYKGHVTIGGQRVDQIPLPAVAPLAGFLLQAPENQLFNPSVIEDVAFGPENLRFSRPEIQRAALGALRFVGMEDYAHRLSDALSGGQTQRVVLSCILAMDPPLFILDQPAAELDPSGRRELYDNIYQLNIRAHKTILVVEDRLSDVVAYATRIILMVDGAIVRDEEPQAFFQSEAVAACGIRVPDVVRLHYLLQGRSVQSPRVFLTPREVGQNFGPALEQAAGASSCTETSGSPGASLPVSRAGNTALRQPESAAIEVHYVHYLYPPGTWALRGVSIEIREGEFVALIGENGAGKTTLAKQLIGLLRPTRGRILVRGRDATKMSIAQLADQVGFLFQNPDHQIFSESVFDEVAFGLKIRRVPRVEIESRVAEMLDRVGLAAYRNHHPYLLSRGQRQRLGFACVLVRRPPILVVDEPSTGLDYAETIDVFDLLSEYRRQGGTVVIITHDMDMVVRHAERSIVMAGGMIYVDTATARLQEHFDMLHNASIRLPDIYYLVEELKLPKSITSLEEIADRISASWHASTSKGKTA
ncbi:MAG: ABC transporter ATP-binding protein [Chloroflexi bacterium]|nr:ABC transporter ATP-binding protein [Chloroflexota bacterium]